MGDTLRSDEMHQKSLRFACLGSRACTYGKASRGSFWLVPLPAPCQPLSAFPSDWSRPIATWTALTVACPTNWQVGALYSLPPAITAIAAPVLPLSTSLAVGSAAAGATLAWAGAMPVLASLTSGPLKFGAVSGLCFHNSDASQTVMQRHFVMERMRHLFRS